MLPRSPRVSRYGPFSDENRLDLLHQRYHKPRTLPQPLLRHRRLAYFGQKSISSRTSPVPAYGRTGTTQTSLAVSSKPITRIVSHSMVKICQLDWSERFAMRYELGKTQDPSRIVSKCITETNFIRSTQSWWNHTQRRKRSKM